MTALPAIQPIHVAAWIEELGKTHSVPTVKQRLAAIRHLFDWMVVGQAMPTNPAHTVRAPKYSVRKGKTPVLSPQEARQLLYSIPTDTIIGLRDRALIGLMTYSFARIGAVTAMEVRDVYVQNRRLWAASIPFALPKPITGRCDPGQAPCPLAGPKAALTRARGLSL